MLYLIFSHTNPEQVVRLARTLRSLSPEAKIAIHHDQSKSTLAASDVAALDDVHLIPNPVCAEWGDFSQVEQYIHATAWCLQHLDFDWMVILTGQSYPLRSLGDFERQLQESRFDAYVYFFDAFDPAHWPRGTAETRCYFRYYKLPKFRYHHKIPASVRAAFSGTRLWLNAHQPFFRIVALPRSAPTRIGVRRLRNPFGPHFKLYGGRMAMNLNRTALESIHAFIEINPWYAKYFRRAVLPDEEFFLTILANNESLKLCNDALRFIKWPKGLAHAANGAVITCDELAQAVDSGAPFGLKFDMSVDRNALDALDTALKLPREANCV